MLAHSSLLISRWKNELKIRSQLAPGNAILNDITFLITHNGIALIFYFLSIKFAGNRTAVISAREPNEKPFSTILQSFVNRRCKRSRPIIKSCFILAQSEIHNRVVRQHLTVIDGDRKISIW